MRRARVATVATVLAAGFVVPGGAAATPAAPSDLRAVDGDGWSAEYRFAVAWRNPTVGTPITAVHFRVRGPSGDVEVGPTRIGWAVQSTTVAVARAGVSTLEVWLEDATGEGPAAALPLRYDPTAPPPVAPVEPTGWIGHAELPLSVRIEPPAFASLSGIRGYAVSVDGSAEGSPCVRADRCTEDETDLRGGPGDDALVLDELPDGVLYLHAVAVSGAGLRSAQVGTVPIRVDTVDPDTELRGAPRDWVNRAVALEARAADPASGMVPRGGAIPYTAIRVDDGAPTVAAGAAVRATVIAEGVHTVAYYARDLAGNVDDGARPNDEPAVARVRIDRSPPGVAFVGSGVGADPELIVARGADALSGLDESRGTIAVRPAGSRGRFEPLPTAQSEGMLRARWRSDEYPPGRYEFEALVVDRAGNRAVSRRRANGSPMILPSPLKPSTTIGIGLGSSMSGSGRSVPFGRGAWLSGRLVGSSDVALDGLPVKIVETFAGGAAPRTRTTTVLTSDRGNFGLGLDPGPSREVTATFAGSPALSASTSEPVTLRVRSRISLRASSAVAVIGGRPILFSGTVASTAGGIPPDGIAVDLQFRARGLSWSGFRTVRTDRRGRFRYRYGFSDDDSRGVRFEFRAVVQAAQSDWPYEPGSSRPVAVRGCPGRSGCSSGARRAGR